VGSEDSLRPGDVRSAGPQLRVYLVDDHEIVREGLRRVLEDDPGITVVGQAGAVGDARRGLLELRPDVAVVDGRLPDGSGVELCALVREELPATRSLLLTSYDDETLIFDAIAAGATGVLLKQVGGTDFVAAVRRVARGESMLHPAVTRRLMDRLAASMHEPAASAASRTRDARPVATALSGPQDATPPAGQSGAGNQSPDGGDVDAVVGRLTPQERRVLALIRAGMSNRAIAAQLGVSEKTVKNHVTHLLAKLGMTRRTQAALFAARLPPASLDDPSDPVAGAEDDGRVASS
jgi:DNA-binding NarL/FixJ family response regulator